MQLSLLVATVLVAVPYVGLGQALEGDGAIELVESAPGAVADKRSFVYGILLNNTPQASDIEYGHRLAVKDLMTVMQGQLPVDGKGVSRPVVAPHRSMSSAATEPSDPDSHVPKEIPRNE